MGTMFWIWIGVIILSVILEAVSMELISIWFTFGAIVPLILSIFDGISAEVQIVCFILISALLIISLRKITRKLLSKDSDSKTNLDSLIGKKFKMLTETDFDTIGTIKVNDIIWNAIGDNKQTIKKGTLVEITKVTGNKLIVKETNEEKLK